jgi:hypothetical protein
MRRAQAARWRKPMRLAALMLGMLSGAQAQARATVWIIPPPFDDGKNLRALFENPAEWAQTRRRIDGIGYADHWLNSQFSDAELRTWLPQIARWHLKFGLEVGALKPWGLTGDQAFAADRKKWDRFIADGAHLDEIAMDEPLAFARMRLRQSIEFAAEQTARFVALVRQYYPAAKVGDIEPYPGIPSSETLQFIDEVQARLRGQGLRGLDFVRLDVDWMHFRPGDPIGQAGWQGVKQVEAECHRRSVKFSLVYWAADFPAQQRAGNATQTTWENGIMYEGSQYASVGGAPDEMMIESWLDTPDRAVPETEGGTFTRSVLDFTAQFAPGAGTGQ